MRACITTYGSQAMTPPAPLEEPMADTGVLIVEEQRMFAEAVAEVLSEVEGLQVVGVVGSGAEACDMVRRLSPDVVLVDHRLSDGTGARAARMIKELRPATNVVMLTAAEDELLLAEAIEAGCGGFVLKSRGLAELVRAVKAAATGQSVIPPMLLGRLVGRLGQAPGHYPHGLTTREVEVLGELATGTPTNDIAGSLGVSVHTVRNHVQSIIRKLNAHSKLEAVSVALREGIVRTPLRAA